VAGADTDEDGRKFLDELGSRALATIRPVSLAVQDAGSRASAFTRSAWEHRPRFPAASLQLAAGVTLGVLAVRTWRRHSQTKSWRGRVALVTCGSRGFGLLIARELAAQDCSIVICARDEADLRRAEGNLRARGAEVLPVRCDVSDEEQVEALVELAIERFGRIDILVNDAGEIAGSGCAPRWVGGQGALRCSRIPRQAYLHSNVRWIDLRPGLALRAPWGGTLGAAGVRRRGFGGLLLVGLGAACAAQAWTCPGTRQSRFPSGEQFSHGARSRYESC
jgi:hypothetical protein